MGEIILTMKGIDKSFPGVHALDHVDFEVRRGELVAVLNRSTGLLRFHIQFEGLSGAVREANFHSPAMEDEVAAPTLAIGRGFSSPYKGRAILSPRQSANLLSGQWYVELRTARFPDGELRGQLIEQAQ